MKKFRVIDKGFWKQIDEAIGEKPGIYKLSSLSDTGPIAVPRIGGIDNDGVLYIGKSENGELRYRLGSLKKSIDTSYTDRNAHSFGSRYHSHPGVVKKYPLDRLFVSIISTDSQPEAGELEKQELADYEKKFGELPPFNRQG